MQVESSHVGQHADAFVEDARAAAEGLILGVEVTWRERGRGAKVGAGAAFAVLGFVGFGGAELQGHVGGV